MFLALIDKISAQKAEKREETCESSPAKTLQDQTRLLSMIPEDIHPCSSSQTAERSKASCLALDRGAGVEFEDAGTEFCPSVWLQLRLLDDNDLVRAFNYTRPTTCTQAA